MRTLIALLLLTATALVVAPPSVAESQASGDGDRTARLASQLAAMKKLGARLTLDDHGRITGVNLSERPVVDADLAHLVGLNELVELDLTRSRITSAGVAHLKDLPSLKVLYLTDTKVDDAGIASLKSLKTLEFIGLSGTKITDESLSNLAGLPKLKKLFCLGTKVTQSGVDKLQRTLPDCLITN